MNPNQPDIITARAPATMANLAVGFDILGMSIGMLYDEVTLTKTHERDKQINITRIDGDGGKLPPFAEKNTATVPLLAMSEAFGWDFGLDVVIKKGIPLSSGLGGSAASAVAAVVAASRLAPKPLSASEMIDFALEGEFLASGSRHPDNIAPCLLGGLVMCGANGRFEQFQLPSSLHYLVIHPNQELETKKAREVLPKNIPLATAIWQSQFLAGFMVGVVEKNPAKIIANLQDLYILPHRKGLIESFAPLSEIKRSLGGTPLHISGAGPSMFTMDVDARPLEKFIAAIKHEKLDSLYGLKCYQGQSSAKGAEIIMEKCQ